MLRILLVTHFFPPELGAASNRMTAFARHLAARGHRVTVLTGRPRYALRAEGEAPGEVRTIRVAGYRPRGRSHAERILDYATTSAGTLVTGLLEEERFDVVLATVPPLPSGLAGLAIARGRGIPLVTDVRDLLPEMAIQLGVMREGSLASRAATAAARWLYRSSTTLLATNEGIADGVRRYRVPGERVRLVPNGIEDTAPALPVPSDDGTVTIAYAGLLGIPQGLETLLDAAALVRDEPRIRFLLIGDGVRREALAARAAGLGNVQFHLTLPREELPRVLAAARALLVILRPELAGSLPSKILDAMALAKPVICSAGGEAARLVKASGCGRVVPPGDSRALAAAARDLLADPESWSAMGRRGRDYGREHLLRSKILPCVEQALLDAVGVAA